ncbi:GNAT family N-acetyltransferase [Umezawaea endophytica]|uniref:GNAT family N-acetyltransferase n=1 Tax=Umezawaea endophytica TaxID=1654476 RepID=A0A9X3AKV4_9PSEU|nr:GNAT family N-acetyltransferase [Umezawaea endophytica]MCS7483480.1 GNAT family N-acetyltransferase [Umezawaea endophytica]
MDPWPFRHLVLRTPRLELRPDDDEGLLELAEQARRGVHPPDEMPFAYEWTDAAPEDVGRNMLQFYWGVRARLAPANWELNFLVRLDGRVVGTQSLQAVDFGVLREVSSGSWIGMEHQGRGIGTEMRAAVLMFAFDHLDAVQARSAAATGNPKSRSVSEKLGYVEDGTSLTVRRGRSTEDVRFLVTRDRLARPGWKVDVTGLTACLDLLTG